MGDVAIVFEQAKKEENERWELCRSCRVVRGTKAQVITKGQKLVISRAEPRLLRNKGLRKG